MAFFNRSDKAPRVRRIIDNLIYDTDKAECVASHLKRRSAGHCRFFSQEILYRSKQNNWFFVLGQRLHVDQPPDVFIQPVTPERAYAWLCEFNEIELIERYFPGQTKYA